MKKILLTFMVFLYFLGNISVYAIQNIEIHSKNIPGNIGLAHMEFVSSKDIKISNHHRSQILFSQSEENKVSYDIPQFPLELRNFSKEKIFSLLLNKEGIPKLKIFRNFERCMGNGNSPGSENSLPTAPIGGGFDECFYTNQALKTNTLTNGQFTLEAIEGKNTFSFYPIDSKKYYPMTLGEADAGKGLIPLTFMDPLAEIYGLHIELRKGESDLIVGDQNIQRKLKLVRYTLRNSDGTSSSTLGVFPYYELILPDGENTYEVSYRYASYTPVVGGNFIRSK